MDVFLRRCVYFIASGLIALASGNDLPASTLRNQERLPDPVRNFFSELGDLFLTVDRTFSTQSAPKTNFADVLKEQIYLRLRRPDHDYFERIQENYKDLQKRVLSTVTRTVGDESSATKPGIDIQNDNGKHFAGVRLPLLPFYLAANSKKPVIRSESVDTISNSNDLPEQTHLTENVSNQHFDGLVNIAESTISVKNQDSKTEAAVSRLSPLEITWKDFQKRMESIPVNQRAKLFPTEDEIKIAVNRFFKDVPQSQEILNALRERGVNVLSVSRTGDIIDETQIDLDSTEDDRTESIFDKYVKQLIENKSKWYLDFPLKRENSTEQNDGQENIDTVTQDFISGTESDTYTEETSSDDSVWNTITGFSSDETTTEVPSSADTFSQVTETVPSPSGMNFLPDDYYEPDSKTQSLIEYVIDPESFTEVTQELITGIYRENEPRDRLLLAFTPDGVPLKLRIGAEIENPIDFLHKLLIAAGVSLNVPVVSFENVEPAGSEVLQLGAGDGQTTTRALYIDIANNEEFKSLVETLRLSKTLKESIAS